jgi:hypothetical protein
MFGVDATVWSCVMVCECGWRAVTLDRLAGWRAARDHERRAHPGQLHAATRVSQNTRRYG